MDFFFKLGRAQKIKYRWLGQGFFFETGPGLSVGANPFDQKRIPAKMRDLSSLLS